MNINVGIVYIGDFIEIWRKGFSDSYIEFARYNGVYSVPSDTVKVYVNGCLKINLEN